MTSNRSEYRIVIDELPTTPSHSRDREYRYHIFIMRPDLVSWSPRLSDVINIAKGLCRNFYYPRQDYLPFLDKCELVKDCTNLWLVVIIEPSTE